MSMADRLVNQTLGFWSFLYDRSMTRWRAAQQELDKRTYGVEDVISDTFGFWSEATNAWLAALTTAQRGVPIVYLHIEPKDQAAHTTVDVFTPALPKAQATLAFFNAEQGGDDRVRDACRVEIVPSQQQLVIRFDGLRKENDPPLKESAYHGLVHCDDVPLAVLYVRVDRDGAAPAPGAAGTPPAGGGA